MSPTGMNLRPRWLIGLAGAAALVLAACSSTSPGSNAPSHAAAVKGGTATVGTISGEQPNWIWPFVPVDYESVPNEQDFQQLMYRPLYMFGNNGDSVQVNYALSRPARPSTATAARR